MTKMTKMPKIKGMQDYLLLYNYLLFRNNIYNFGAKKNKCIIREIY